MTITLFSYSKRDNSTARPSLSSGTDFNCKLKTTCSIMTPTLEFNLSFSVMPQTYNYCYIPNFQRYYWIKNWVYVGRLWIAMCAVDVLASHRTDILNSNQYILRSASAYDGAVTDSLYPLTNNKSISKHVIDLGYKNILGEGTYVVGVINGDDNAMGCVSYYYMSQTEFGLLKDYLLKPIGTGSLSRFLTELMNSVTDISEGAVKALFNPLQYIASCSWFPFQFWHETVVPGSVTDLPFGWWTLASVSAERIPESEFKKTVTVSVTLQDHPQAAERGSYMNAPPYTDYVLYLPPFGSIPIDGALCASLTSKTVSVIVDIDIITGAAICSVLGTIGNSQIYLCPVVQAPLAIPIQLSQVTMNLAQDITTTTTAITADTVSDNFTGSGRNRQHFNDTFKDIHSFQEYMVAMGDKFAGAFEEISNALGITDKVQSVTSNISSAAKAKMTELWTSGANGNMASLQTQAYLLQVFYSAMDSDNSHRGRPLCKKRVLNTLSGYTMIADPDFALAAPSPEIEAIKAYMLSGFYIE